MSSIFTGSCHCGRLGVELITDIAAEDFTPRACQCSFCRRHAAAYISDSGGSVTITTSGLEADIYRQGFQITDFHVCQRCGVLIGATWTDRTGATFAVINMRSLNRSGAITTNPVLADFDGENVAAREERRRGGWTPAILRNGRR